MVREIFEPRIDLSAAGFNQECTGGYPDCPLGELNAAINGQKGDVYLARVEAESLDFEVTNEDERGFLAACPDCGFVVEVTIYDSMCGWEDEESGEVTVIDHEGGVIRSCSM